MTDDDLFGDYNLPQQDQANAPPPQGGYGGAAPSPGYSAQPPTSAGYDPTPNVQQELAQLDQDIGRSRMTAQYSRMPKAKGAVVAKVAGPLGIASILIALAFIGSALGEMAADSVIGIAGLICIFGLPLGALLSVGAIVLAIIALALGAGEHKGKAIFAIVFGVLYWVMIGAFWILMIFVISMEINSATQEVIPLLLS